MSKRILVLDAGGPGSMAVLKIMKKAKLPCMVIACDMNELSPARLFADMFIQVPPAKSDDYGSAIEGIIKKDEIDLVVPSFHYGFEKLSKIQTTVFLNDFKLGLLFQDKLKFSEACRQYGLSTPSSRLLSEVGYIELPVYIKPRFGAGSKNNFIARNDKELSGIKGFLEDPEEYVVQELLEGEHWQTEGLRLGGELLSCTTFRTLVSQAGNLSTVLIKENKNLTDYTKIVMEKFDFNGPFNLETFIKDGEITLIEINPRFGSTVEFTAFSGADTVSYIITSDKRHLKPIKEGVYTRYGEIAHLR